MAVILPLYIKRSKMAIMNRFNYYFFDFFIFKDYWLWQACSLVKY